MTIVDRKVMVKEAGKVHDFLGHTITSTVAWPVSAAASTLGAAMSKEPEEPASEKSGLSEALAYIPAVGSYRVGRRLKETVQDAANPNVAMNNLLAETVAPYTSTAFTAALGALIGLGGAFPESRKKMNPVKTLAQGVKKGLLVGAGVGAGANVVGGVQAAIDKTRSRTDQRKHDRTTHILATLLVPGYGIYQDFKRYGSSEPLREYHAEKEAADKKPSVAGDVGIGLIGGVAAYDTHDLSNFLEDVLLKRRLDKNDTAKTRLDAHQAMEGLGDVSSELSEITGKPSTLPAVKKLPLKQLMYDALHTKGDSMLIEEGAGRTPQMVGKYGKLGLAAAPALLAGKIIYDRHHKKGK